MCTEIVGTSNPCSVTYLLHFISTQLPTVKIYIPTDWKVIFFYVVISNETDTPRYIFGLYIYIYLNTEFIE